MRLYRLLRVLGIVAVLATILLASLGLPALTTPEWLRISGVALPALALLLLSRSLRRAQKAMGPG
jgi:riboflavin transporter FmnP